MTVGVAQSRINQMNNIVKKISDCIGKLNSEDDKEKIKSLKNDYGITIDLLHEARQFLSITANNFQEDLDNCDVNCQCWWGNKTRVSKDKKFL